MRHISIATSQNRDFLSVSVSLAREKLKTKTNIRVGELVEQTELIMPCRNNLGTGQVWISVSQVKLNGELED